MIQLNEYFDSNVKSLSINNKDGNSSVGVMLKGEYSFGTNSIEIMNIISGTIEIQLPNSEEWKTFSNEESFRVEKDSTFHVKCTADVAYWCQYL